MNANQQRALQNLATWTDKQLKETDLTAQAMIVGVTVEELLPLIVEARKEKNKPVVWRERFHTISELQQGQPKMYIDRILPEGISCIGSLSGVGKTWFALSMAKALNTGTKFLGVFDVPEKVPVLYLVPEMGARSVRLRAEKLHIPMDEMFFCQTISDGPCKLDDPALEAAIKELKPIVFLDTAIRFGTCDDENSAKQNSSLLASDLFRFRRLGAPAVVCLHHSPKSSGMADEITLENVLRGSGDFGAMCDCVWGLQHDRCKLKNGKWDLNYLEESQNLTRLFVKCVKPRDFEPAPPFRVLGRPHIDLDGDLRVIKEDRANMDVEVPKAIAENPQIEITVLMSTFHCRYETIVKVAAKGGWEWKKNGWIRPADIKKRQNVMAFNVEPKTG
jgi:hypothetical protein